MFDDVMSRLDRPGASQVSGAPPVPSRPHSFVAPLSAASGPVGRPPLPPTAAPFAGGAGQPLPVGPQSRPGGPSAPQAGPASQRPPTPPAPARQDRGASPAGTPAQQGAGQGQAVEAAPALQLDHMPSKAELADMPPGLSVTTPYGAVTSDGRLIPSPEGAALYQQHVAQARKTFGPYPFANIPDAPPPPVKLGRSWFNPFTGNWGRA